MELLSQLRYDIYALRQQHSYLKAGLREYHSVYYMEVRPFFMRAIYDELKVQVLDSAANLANKLRHLQTQLVVVKQITTSAAFEQLVEGLSSEIDYVSKTLLADVKQTVEITQ